MMMLLRALRIAVNVHGRQTDKAGRPYLEHVVDVAMAVRAHGETAVTVALLHDVVEDSDMPLALISAQFPREVAVAVAMLTRGVDETYTEYIKRLTHDELARLIKVADIEDHLRKDLPAEFSSLHKRYVLALEYLTKEKKDAGPETA